MFLICFSVVTVGSGCSSLISIVGSVCVTVSLFVCLSVVCYFCFTVLRALLPEIKDCILFYFISKFV